MKRNSSDEDRKDGNGSPKTMVRKAAEAQRIAEQAKKHFRTLRADFKLARKAYKQAKKAARKARKEAKVAIKLYSAKTKKFNKSGRRSLSPAKRLKQLLSRPMATSVSFPPASIIQTAPST
jgi:hypothetical protein